PLHARNCRPAAGAAPATGDPVPLHLLAFMERRRDAVWGSEAAFPRRALALDRHLSPEDGPADPRTLPGAAERTSRVRGERQHPRAVPAGRHDVFGYILRAQR